LLIELIPDGQFEVPLLLKAYRQQWLLFVSQLQPHNHWWEQRARMATSFDQFRPF